MFASCFVVFRIRANNAVWKDEHDHKAKTETNQNRSFIVFFVCFFVFWKTEIEIAVSG